MSDIYFVLIINLIVWTGIFVYLVSLHSKINKIKSRLEEKLSEERNN